MYSIYIWHATCNMLHAICYMLHATCYMLHATCYMLHEFLNHMLAKASVWWSIANTAWVSFITLHDFLHTTWLFFAPIIWFKTPLMTDLWVPLHEFPYTTWTFCHSNSKWNASVGWCLTSTTWDPLHYMSFWTIRWQRHLLEDL